jgi:hypothetical protein
MTLIRWRGEFHDSFGSSWWPTLRAAAGQEVLAISAGNYGGKLGKFHFHLRELLKWNVR